MKATRASLRARRIPEGGNVMMQYFHDLGMLTRSQSSSLIVVRDGLQPAVLESLLENTIVFTSYAFEIFSH